MTHLIFMKTATGHHMLLDHKWQFGYERSDEIHPVPKKSGKIQMIVSPTRMIRYLWYFAAMN